MKKRMAIMLIIVIIVFGGIVGFYFFKQYMMKKIFSNMKPPAATVTTQVVSTKNWTPYISAVGSLKAMQSINVAPAIAGTITKIYFHSGEYVQAGTPLVDLDTSNQRAQLSADQAQLALAKSNYARDIILLKRKAISQSTIDASLQQLQSAQAAVQGDLATLRKMHIVAPFAGKLGIREVSLGQYIAPPPATGGNIVPLSSIDPMLVEFSLPQQDLPKVHIGQKIQLTVDAYPGKTFTGNIIATNAEVTQTSRTIIVQAHVSNPRHELVAGMSGLIHILLPIENDVVTVPQTAIVYSLYGNSVYVVNKDKTVKQTFVTLGQTQDINIAIEKGLEPGVTIVTAGQLKLHNGAQIKVNNKVLPN